MDRLEAAKYIKDHCLGSEVYRDGTTWNDAMVTAVEALEGKDTNAPTNSALDHIHNVVAENSFNKGYDAGYAEGYERGKADAALSASNLVKRLMEKFDDVLSVSDVLEELKELEAATKGE